jgi:benzoyl-CoA reductase/2-hydroxyglutaryl-CoA dehydratase subunit BcrC/BadD/HgdB
MEGTEFTGMFNRVSAILKTLKHLPDRVSDEDIEGLEHFVTGSLAATAKSALAPRTRDATLAIFDSLVVWMEGFERARREGKKIIMTSLTIPVELFYCFKNAYPVTNELITTLGGLLLEGNSDRYWDFAMGAGLPDTMCSSSGVSIGANIMHVDFQPTAVASGYPGDCDTNAKQQEFLAQYLGVPHLMVEKPVDDSARGREQYLQSTHDFIEKLEDLLGEKMDEELMREVAENHNKGTELYWELSDMLRLSPCPVPNVAALYVVAIGLTMWGKKEGVQSIQRLVDASRRNLEENDYKEKVRSLWCWTGFYYDLWEFFTWMEERGITYLGDALSILFPNFIDTSSRDTIIEGFANFAWDYPMTRQMGSPSMSAKWTDDIIHSARERRADCVFFAGHHSCKHAWSIFSIVRKEVIKKARVPVFALEGDTWLRKSTALYAIQHQIEEFVDNVVVKKKASA